jgi:hypothetical protein
MSRFVQPDLHHRHLRFRFQFRGRDYPGRRGEEPAVFVWLGEDPIISPALKYSGGAFPDWVPVAMRQPVHDLWLLHQPAREAEPDGH